MKKTLLMIVLLLALPSFAIAQITLSLGSDTPAPSAARTHAVAAPRANFSASVLRGLAPFTTNFTSTSVNASSYLWRFGDGNTTNNTQANPSHTYSHPGTYSVTLTASSISGSTSTTKKNYIVVAANPNAPDLVPLNVWGSPSAQVGDTIDLTDTITNNGGMEADNFTVGIYLSQSSTVNPSQDPLLTYRIVQSLPPGGTSSGRGGASGGDGSYVIVPTIPSYIVPGSYYLAVVVDVADNIAELSPSGHTMVGTQQIEITGIPGNSNSQPDLTPVVIAPPAAWPGATGNISITVQNIGGAEATGFYVAFYASTSPTGPVNPNTDIFIGGANFDALGAGAYESQIANVCLPPPNPYPPPNSGATPNINVPPCIEIPSALSGGTFYIGVFVDPLNELVPVESSRTNNTIKSTYPTTF